MRSRASKSQFQELCYGIPVELIALWLQVSATVARKYKSGFRAPCPAALQLFKLKLEGRVVPDEWHGFSFRGGQLFGPDNRAFTQGHLRAYGLGMQLPREYARGDVKRNAEVERIFEVAGQMQYERFQIRSTAPYTELAYFGPIFKLLGRWIMPVPMLNSIGYVLFPRRSKRDSIKRSARVLDYWPFCEQSTGLNRQSIRLSMAAIPIAPCEDSLARRISSRLCGMSPPGH
jgi:hypothetical protein